MDNRTVAGPSAGYPPDLLSFSFGQLSELLASLGEPSYRAEQIYPRMQRGIPPGKMGNIPAKLVAELEERAPYRLPEIARKLVSSVDGTVKYLLRLADGNLIETVLMRYRHGNTVCVSTQVGCRMGCAFCASTLGGRIRNMTAGEILGEVIAAGNDSGERVDNIVMMGIGEPLDNYEASTAFIRLVSDPRGGLCIGQRHISLSTCGVVDGIDRLAAEKFQITLSVSLHAHDDAVRDAVMPVNRRWNISELLAACRRYAGATGRRISFEYTLISGKNCGEKDAAALAELLNRALRRGTMSRYPIHVNLIPLNSVRERDLRAPDRAQTEAFRQTLEKHGVRATVRRTLGPDINASCGQLRRSAAETGDTAGTENKQEKT